MNEPRPGKRLLVLDLDYSALLICWNERDTDLVAAMVDTKPLIAGSLPSDECARPGLHEFLEQWGDRPIARSIIHWAMVVGFILTTIL